MYVCLKSVFTVYELYMKCIVSVFDALAIAFYNHINTLPHSTYDLVDVCDTKVSDDFTSSSLKLLKAF